MNLSKLSISVVLWMGIGLVAAIPTRTEAAAALPSSAPAIPTTIVIRGSSPAAAQPSTANDSSPVVLRGSPPPAAPPPAAEYACPLGDDLAASRGCVVPGYIYNPDDYAYWPYYGFDGFSPGRWRRGFRHAFARIGRGSALDFGHHPATGFGRGLAHAGFAHR